MGLDVIAYSRVSFVEVLPDYEEWEEKYEVLPRRFKTYFLAGDQDFPERLAPLFVPTDGIAVYRIDGGEEFGFRAGSHGYYNRWREQLSMMANGVMPLEIWSNRDRPEVRRLPFYLLVDFSDCEGVIGTAAARVLAHEFAQFQPQADQHADSKFRETYGKFRKAFELASDDGFVSFG